MSSYHPQLRMTKVTPGPDILQRPLLTQITAVNTAIQEELTYNRAQKNLVFKDSEEN